MKNSLKPARLAPQLAETLLRRIWLGIYPSGTQLPSARLLQKEFCLGKHTVEAAVAILAGDGYLKSHPGRPPLITMRRKPGIYRVALLASNIHDVSEFRYETSPSGWLYVDTVRQALHKHRQQCVLLPNETFLPQVKHLIDGVIYFDFGDTPNVPPPATPLPVLTVCYGTGLNAIRIDRAAALEKAAYYMISHGIRSVVSLQRGNDQAHSERERFLRALLRDYGLPPDAFHVVATGDVLEKYAIAPLRQFLSGAPQLPLGIFAQGDLLARGAAKVALSQGLRLKKDAVIIGCTGLPEAAHWHPAVTSIISPFAALGECAARTMAALIRDNRPVAAQIITGQFIIRET